MGSTDGGKRSLGPRTVLYPTPVMVVGTYDEAGRPEHHDGRLGRHRLLGPALHLGVGAAEGAAHVRRSDAAQGVHGQHPLGRPRRRGRLRGHGVGGQGRQVRGDRPDRGGERGGRRAVRGRVPARAGVQAWCRPSTWGRTTCSSARSWTSRPTRRCWTNGARSTAARLRPVSYGCEESVYYGLGAVVGKAFDAGRRFKGTAGGVERPRGAAGPTPDRSPGCVGRLRRGGQRISSGRSGP